MLGGEVRMKSIQQLKDSLNQEIKLYKAVLTTAKGKTQAIKTAQLKELEEVIEKEQEYIRAMGAFEKIRRSIFANIAQELNIAQPDSISELILHLDDDEGKELDDLRTELLKTIKRLADVNELNEKLIQQNLDFINFNIGLLTSLSDIDSNYGEKDKGSKKSISSILDMKV